MKDFLWEKIFGKYFFPPRTSLDQFSLMFLALNTKINGRSLYSKRKKLFWDDNACDLKGNLAVVSSTSHNVPGNTPKTAAKSLKSGPSHDF